MRFLIVLSSFLVAPLASIGQFSVDSAAYVWPTDASPYLSGTFAETRSEHFHSALDIKTWARKGYRVFATRDGVLHRIAIGPKGYGKVLYLKHPDNSYSVYAHLLSSEENIQQLADSIRMSDYSFEIDRIVDSLDITIKQGEVIGYSGASGVGPPHLHFELRTPDQKPFNPLLTNLTIRDRVSPQFSGLTVEPLSPETVIEGQNQLYRRKAGTQNEMYDFGTIRVHGPVGLGVDVFDLADRVGNAYAVYEIKLYLEDSLIFHSRVDSFSYDETGQLFLDRVYPLLKKTGEGYQRLFLVDGNTLPFYKYTKNRGRLNLPGGKHRLKIVASDYFGNSSTAEVLLNVTDEQTPSGRSIPASNGDWSSPSEWNWYSNWIRFNGNGSDYNTVFATDIGDAYGMITTVSSDSLLSLRKDFISLGNIPGNHLFLQRVFPSHPARIYGNNSGAYASFEEHSFYDTLSVALRETVLKPDSIQVQLMPDNQPVRKQFELTYIFEASFRTDSSFAFYQFSPRKKELNYIPSQKNNVVLKGEAGTLGTYIIMRDTTAPEIIQPDLYRREDGHWIVSVTARDDRSGIDYKSAVFVVNGNRGIAEFEPENDRLIYYHPDFLPSDRNTVRVKVSDKLGNRTERKFEIGK